MTEPATDGEIALYGSEEFHGAQSHEFTKALIARIEAEKARADNAVQEAASVAAALHGDRVATLERELTACAESTGHHVRTREGPAADCAVSIARLKHERDDLRERLEGNSGHCVECERREGELAEWRDEVDNYKVTVAELQNTCWVCGSPTAGRMLNAHREGCLLRTMEMIGLRNEKQLALADALAEDVQRYADTVIGWSLVMEKLDAYRAARGTSDGS